MVKSKKNLNPEDFLQPFSLMCKKSRAPDGDKQQDGWGVAWQKERHWIEKKSLHPIWKDKKNFSKIPPTQLLVVHARSAGFPNQKGYIEYNQPYIKDDLCFVFNGMIRGVQIPFTLEGKIGAQKIFSFLLKDLKEKDPKEALDHIDKTIQEHSQKIEGMNIGLIRKNNFYILCQYDRNDSYFGLRYYKDHNLTLVFSEPILSYNWKAMKKGELLLL